jgi:hypothetical protein
VALFAAHAQEGRLEPTALQVSVEVVLHVALKRPACFRAKITYNSRISRSRPNAKRRN